VELHDLLLSNLTTVYTVSTVTFVWKTLLVFDCVFTFSSNELYNGKYRKGRPDTKSG